MGGSQVAGHPTVFVMNPLPRTRVPRGMDCSGCWRAWHQAQRSDIHVGPFGARIRKEAVFLLGLEGVKSNGGIIQVLGGYELTPKS